MRCPYCSHEEQRVLDSRPARDGFAIRRRRECEGCARRFTTFEETERPRLFIVKRDGSREEFDREKVMRGIVIACQKRPVSAVRISEIVSEIETELTDEGGMEVESQAVGRMALEKLLDLDEVAYVRFASVYEQFESPEEFSRIVQRLKPSRKDPVIRILD